MTGLEIKDLRLKMGLSQAAFGKLIPAEISTVYRWEKNKHPISKIYLDRILAIEKQFEEGKFDKV